MERAFGFEIEYAFRAPDDDRVLTAKVRTGSGVILVGPGMEFFGTRATPDPDRVSSMTYVFVDDVDAPLPSRQSPGRAETSDAAGAGAASLRVRASSRSRGSAP